MTAPANATTRGDGKRTYSWRNETYWSVTTILGGGVPKPFLLPWGMKAVAQAAVASIDILPRMVEEDPDSAVDWLKRRPYVIRDRAADLGTAVHTATEAYILGKPIPTWPVEIRPRMSAFTRFLEAFTPTYELTEASVYSRSQRYAGTLDAIAVVNGRRLLLDTKTGKRPYPEAALQMAAYRYADFIGLPDGSEVPMPTVDGCAVLHLPADTGIGGPGYELVEVRADKDVFTAFLYCREVFRWVSETSKTVLLPALTPDSKAFEEETKPLAEMLSKRDAGAPPTASPSENVPAQLFAGETA